MRNKLIAVVAVLVAVAGFAPAAAAGGVATAATQDGTSCEYPVELTDATGETITLEEPPERVVALQPSDAQKAFEIGAEEKVVGMQINEYTDYLDAGDREDVSGEEDIDVETVVGLEPDVVLAANVTGQETIEQLREAGLTVYHFHQAASIDEIQENVEIAGQLTGECDGAAESVQWMDERLDAIATALEGEERPLTYWSLGGGWTAGNETFQHEILTTAGVENLGAKAGIVGWQQISDEVVVEEDPEWIVYGYQNEGDDPALSEGAKETTAYQNDQIVGVNANYVNQPGPLVVLAVEEIVEEIHPEAYEEAQAALEESDGQTGDENESENETDQNGADDENSTDDESGGDETGDENATDDGNGTDGEESDEGTDTDGSGESGDGDVGDETGDSIPGFGVPVAVAGLIAALGFALRRR